MGIVWGVVLITAPGFGAPVFETEIKNLESKIVRVEGRELADSLERLVDLYDNRSPKQAIVYCTLLHTELKKLGDNQGMADNFYNWGNYYYYTGFYKKALGIYQRMMAHCEKNDLQVYLGKAYVLTGRVYYRQGYYDRAMEYYDRSLEIRTAIEDRPGIYCSLNNIGHVHAQLGNYAKAVKFQYDSLKGYEDMENRFGIGYSYENIGKAYFTLGNYDRALEFFLKSYEAYQEIKDVGFMGYALLNMGNCYRRVGEHKLALEHYDRGMVTAQKLNLGWIIPWAMAYKSAVYNDIGKHDQAIELNIKAQQQFLKIEDQAGLYFTHKNFSMAYLEKEELKTAKKHMEIRLALAKENNDRKVLADSYNFLGTIYTRLLNHDMAQDMLAKGQALSKQLHANDLLSENQKQASILFAAMGNHKKGLESFKQYRDIENQKTSRTMKGKLLEIQTAYEQQRLELEKTVSRLYWSIAAIAGALVVFFITRGFRHYHRELARKTDQNRALQMESKLKLFQARVNPHFLFNSLDSVIQQGRDNDPKRLEYTLLKLSNVYRNILAMPDLPEVTLIQEMGVVKDYLEIEKQISHNKIAYTIDLPPALESSKIIPLCVLTLAENAVKHGLSPDKQGGNIQILVQKIQDQLIVQVKDNGLGFDVNKMGQGFGLYSIQKRFELYYKGRAVFTIKSEKGVSTTATLRIPHEII